MAEAKHPMFIQCFRELYMMPDLSYRDIATALNNQFGGMLTRSAVSGMARRQGLARVQGVKAPAKKLPTALSGIGGSTRGFNPGNAIHRMQQAAARKAREAREADARAKADAAKALQGGDVTNLFKAGSIQGLVTFMQRADDGCRWPFECDDGVTRYCPNKVMQKKSYCIDHHDKGSMAVRKREVVVEPKFYRDKFTSRWS